jgi:uncharacterized cupin superfamily protein
MNDKLALPAVDPEEISVRVGTQYPASLAAPCAGWRKRVLGDGVGLSHFGVNMVELPPGSQSSLRHWHSAEDEFVFILDGVVTLVTNEGAQELGPGMAAGFPAGRANGHHLINKGDEIVRYLEVGDRAAGEDRVEYSDVDLRIVRGPGGRTVTRRDGSTVD